MERVVARAASSLSSAEVTGKKKKEKAAQSDLPKMCFTSTWNVWVNRSLQQTVKLKKTDASTQLSQFSCDLIFGSIRRVFFVWEQSLHPGFMFAPLKSKRTCCAGASLYTEVFWCTLTLTFLCFLKEKHKMSVFTMTIKVQPCDSKRQANERQFARSPCQLNQIEAPAKSG